MGSLWPGIWRVSREISGFNEIQWDLEAPPVRSTRTVLFCDRIVKDKWNRSFTARSCEISYASPLSSDELNELENHLAADDALTDSFRKYQTTPHPLHLIANISLGGMTYDVVGGIPSVCEQILSSRIEQGLTVTDVLKLLAEADLIQYKSQNPTRVTVQLTCLDHETNSNEFVFRGFRILRGRAANGPKLDSSWSC